MSEILFSLSGADTDHLLFIIRLVVENSLNWYWCWRQI